MIKSSREKESRGGDTEGHGTASEIQVAGPIALEEALGSRMHRTFAITVTPEATDQLLRGLADLDEVVGLSVSRGASIKPPGDVLTVHILNRGADKVLKLVADAGQTGPISVATAELASIIDPSHTKAVDNDVDEAVWEEMAAGLRHQGRVTANFLTLMAAGGAVAAVGMVSESTPQSLAIVAAAVIAPGFEPLAKVPLGLVLGRWEVVRRGLFSAGVGYAMLVLAAGLAFAMLRAVGGVGVEEFATNPEVKRLGHPTAGEALVSACAAVAGAVMIAAYRRSVIAGPLIALVLVHAAAAVGVALACGRFDLAGNGLLRLGMDVAIIVVLCAAVFAIKQAAVHRRRPL